MKQGSPTVGVVDDLFALFEHTRASLPLDALAGLTLLSIVPLIAVMTTSFVRIVVVLSLVRSAIGSPTIPPSMVLTGLAIVLTVLVMTPTIHAIQHDALQPYAHGRLSQSEFVARAVEPLRRFMVRQTRAKDLALFARVAHRSSTEIPVLVPAFVVGELRSAFAIGVALYLPFLAIDLAVAAILMSLGMMMLSPPIVSLPLKLLLFVSVDGWALVCAGVTASFR